jgi:hypothetical protein
MTWSKTEIRAARQIELAPRLEKRGLDLCDRGGGNYEVQQYKGLILKASYWLWPDQNQAGNAIDFYVQVLGLSRDRVGRGTRPHAVVPRRHARTDEEIDNEKWPLPS